MNRDAGLDVRIARLAIALLGPDIGLHDVQTIEDQRIGN